MFISYLYIRLRGPYRPGLFLNSSLYNMQFLASYNYFVSSYWFDNQIVCWFIKWSYNGEFSRVRAGSTFEPTAHSDTHQIVLDRSFSKHRAACGYRQNKFKLMMNSLKNPKARNLSEALMASPFKTGLILYGLNIITVKCRRTQLWWNAASEKRIH